MAYPKRSVISIIHNDSDNKSLKRFQLSEAVLLAGASAVAYLFAFLYERGFTSFFGIPTQFVNVSLVTLLIFGAGVFTLLILTLGLIDMFFPFMPKHPYLAHYIPRLTLQLFIFILIPIVLLEGHRWRLFVFMFGAWLGTVFLMLILPLITKRKRGDWKKIYDAEMEREIQQSPPGPGLYNLIGNRYGLKNLSLSVFMIFYCSLLASMAGEAQAMNQQNFLVLNTTPEMVVLRVYGENIICAPFDRTAKEVKKGFLILKMAEDSKLIMNLETVGPLKPVEKLTSETAASPTPIPSP